MVWRGTCRHWDWHFNEPKIMTHTPEALERGMAAQAPLDGPQLPARQEPEPTSLMEVIARASRDPSVDVDKLERLLGMAERLEARQAKAAYTKALVEMKPKLPVIDKRGKIIIRDKSNRENIIQSTPYSLWEDIDEAITPILAEHGFVLTFRSGIASDGKLTVAGILSHKDGH